MPTLSRPNLSFNLSPSSTSATTSSSSSAQPRRLNNTSGSTVSSSSSRWAPSASSAASASGTPSSSSKQSGPVGAWNRLKPAPRDDLTTYGFPSKGETRLNDHKAQELYFHHIFTRYMQFCHASRADLAAELSRLHVSPPLNYASSGLVTISPATALAAVAAAAAAGAGQGPGATTKPMRPKTEANTSTRALDCSSASTAELVLIHTAMRKLRESLVATRRTDDFARCATLFIVRACILSKAWESYLPALSYLVLVIHKSATPISDSDLREVTAYRVLDYACRLGDLAAAWTLLHERKSDPQSEHLASIVRALMRDEWWRYWQMKNKVDGYFRAIMDFADERVRKHALKCLASTYFTVDKSFVEQTADRQWDALVHTGLGWQLESAAGRQVVVIRRPKVKTTT